MGRTIYSQDRLWSWDHSDEINRERKRIEWRLVRRALRGAPHLTAVMPTRQAWRECPARPIGRRGWTTWETAERRADRAMPGRVVSGVYGRAA